MYRAEGEAHQDSSKTIQKQIQGWLSSIYSRNKCTSSTCGHGRQWWKCSSKWKYFNAWFWSQNWTLDTDMQTFLILEMCSCDKIQVHQRFSERFMWTQLNRWPECVRLLLNSLCLWQFLTLAKVMYLKLKLFSSSFPLPFLQDLIIPATISFVWHREEKKKIIYSLGFALYTLPLLWPGQVLSLRWCRPPNSSSVCHQRVGTEADTAILEKSERLSEKKPCWPLHVNAALREQSETLRRYNSSSSMKSRFGSKVHLRRSTKAPGSVREIPLSWRRSPPGGRHNPVKTFTQCQPVELLPSGISTGGPTRTWSASPTQTRLCWCERIY